MPQKVGLPHGVLVLVGDGSKALFFKNTGTPLHPKLVVAGMLEQENPPTREQGTDRPGRYASNATPTFRSAVEQTDWHQLAEDRFASRIADALYQGAHANQYQLLIIVAPPKVLGTLRKSLHKEVLSRIEAEVPKELATYTVPELQKELATWRE
jgi:protein required for attachment to host cells